MNAKYQESSYFNWNSAIWAQHKELETMKSRAERKKKKKKMQKVIKIHKKQANDYGISLSAS